ncbi:MAG TPA: hypothetical protein VF867_06100 [Arthrobacter sp.]
MVTKPNPRRPHVQDPELDRKVEEFGLAAVVAPQLVVRPRPESASVGFNFKMTPTDHARLKRVAEYKGRSLQKVLNMIVWPAIAEIEKEL